MTLIGHASFSQFTTWIQCGKKYQLSRILQVPSVPAWYLVGGKTFHRCAEDFQRWMFEHEGR